MADEIGKSGERDGGTEDRGVRDNEVGFIGAIGVTVEPLKRCYRTAPVVCRHGLQPLQSRVQQDQGYSIQG